MRWATAALWTFAVATPALAQDPPSGLPAQTPASIVVLQNMVGQLAGQNAQLIERVQQLTAANAELQKRAAPPLKTLVPPPKAPEAK